MSDPRRRPRVLIAAGGTAGHVVPALAIAAALREAGAEVEFAGGERAEAELVPAAGYPFHPLEVAGLDRRNPLKAARAAGLAARAVGKARKLVHDGRFDAVMGGGGCVAGPVGLAALTRRVPLALTEADSHRDRHNGARAAPAHRVPGVPARGPRRGVLRGDRAPDPAGDGRRRPQR